MYGTYSVIYICIFHQVFRDKALGYLQKRKKSKNKELDNLVITPDICSEMGRDGDGLLEYQLCVSLMYRYRYTVYILVIAASPLQFCSAVL